MTPNKAAPLVAPPRQRLTVPPAALRLFSRVGRATVLNGRFPVHISLQRSTGEIAAAALGPVGRNVAVTNQSIGGVPAQRVTPLHAKTDRYCLYLHGGGYNIGSPSTHRALATALAVRIHAEVISVAYRRAPENPFPAALDDAYTAYAGLLDAGVRSEQIVIAGDSAGGGLALSLAHRLRDTNTPVPSILALISPWLDLTLTDTHPAPGRNDPLLSLGILRHWASNYCAGHDLADPCISPIAGNMAGLPPIVVHVGTDDLLYRDTERLSAIASATGLRVRTRVLPGVTHVPHVFCGRVSEAATLVNTFGDDIIDVLSPAV